MDIVPALTSNVGLALTDMMLGKQFSKTDAEFKDIVETMDVASQVSSVSGAINYVPWIRQEFLSQFLLIFLSEPQNYVYRNFSTAGTTLKAYKNCLERNHTTFQALLDKQMKSVGSANNNIRSVLEAYAVEVFDCDDGSSLYFQY